MLCYIPYFLMALFFGFGAFYGPGHFITTAISMHLSPEAGITIGFLAVHVAVIFYPVLQKWSVVTFNCKFIKLIIVLLNFYCVFF